MKIPRLSHKGEANYRRIHKFQFGFFRKRRIDRILYIIYNKFLLNPQKEYFLAISPKDIIPLTKARAKLTELCEQVHQEGCTSCISFHCRRDRDRFDQSDSLQNPHFLNIV